MGVAPVSSIPFAISNASGRSFSSMVLVVYTGLVAIQFLLRGKQRQWRDLFQIPFSIAFSAFLDWFGALLDISVTAFYQRLALVLVALVFVFVGVALTVRMNLAPNPPDGLAQAISVRFGKSMGLSKNVLDCICVTISGAVDLLTSGKLRSIGIGTVIFVIFTGRIIALFDRFFTEKVLKMAGITRP